MTTATSSTTTTTRTTTAAVYSGLDDDVDFDDENDECDGDDDPRPTARPATADTRGSLSHLGDSSGARRRDYGWRHATRGEPRLHGASSSQDMLTLGGRGRPARLRRRRGRPRPTASDAPTVLAWVGAQTERIGLGAAVMQIPARTPAMTAMTAATLDTLSGGRFRLGLGVSGPAGQRGLARRALRRSRWRAPASTSTSSAGAAPRDASVCRRALHAAAARRSGQGAEADHAPAADHMPIYLAAVGPKNLELTGEIADGWLAIFFCPEHSGDLVASVADGRRAGRARAPTDEPAGRASTSCPPCRSSSPTTSRPAAAPSAPTPRSTSAAWARGRRTSTTSWPAAWASRRRPPRSRSCTSPGSTGTRPRPCPSSSSTPPALIGPRERIAERLSALRRRRASPRWRSRRSPATSRSGCDACGPWPSSWARLAYLSRSSHHAILPAERRPSTLSYLEAVVLGIVEGLTEFLPVSSTGHLTIAEKLLGLHGRRPAVTAFTAVIQIGAIVATSSTSGKDIVRLLVAWVARAAQRAGAHAPRLPARLGRHRRLDPGRDRRLPAKDLISGPLRSLWVVAVALIALERGDVARRGGTPCSSARGGAQRGTPDVKRRPRHRARPVLLAHPRRLPLGRHDLGRPDARHRPA